MTQVPHSVMNLHPDSLRYNTIVRRIWAWLIDLVIFVPFLVFELYLFDKAPSLLIWGLWTAVSNLIPFAYQIFCHGKFGQTLGKRVMHLKVLSRDERPVSYARAFLRTTPFLVFSIISASISFNDVVEHGFTQYDIDSSQAQIETAAVTSLLVVSLITGLMDKRRRTFYDQLAGTVVVRTDVN